MANVDDLSTKCLVLNFHKSIAGGRVNSDRNAFFTWGALDFLSVEVFESLAQYHVKMEQNRVSKENLSSLIEEHRFFLYSDAETDTKGKAEIDWIFESTKEYPLILITLLESNQLKNIRTLLERNLSPNQYLYQLFKTLGQDICAIVFRSYTYKYVLDSIVEISQFCKNTYSVAGVQKGSGSVKGKKHQRPYLFMDERPVLDYQNGPLDCCVSIHYRLRETKQSGSRLENTVSALKGIISNFLARSGLSTEDMRISLYYQIGYYDIELVLEGDTFRVLEILLNPDYGLANEEGDFYHKYIFESRTIWKSPINFSG